VGSLVSVVVVTWNSANYIQLCLNFLLDQTYKELELVIIDNSSTDGTRALLQREGLRLRRRFIPVQVVENKRNEGFSRAQNQGIRLSHGEHLLSLNPDVQMTSTFIEAMVQAIEADERIGSVSGKLLRASVPHNVPGREVIDSTGLFIDRRRRTRDRGQGEVDGGQYDDLQEIFSACGAAALYRRSMLEDVAIEREVFDEDFFAYYDDVDLGWRAQLCGWQCLYAPEAIAYHVRGGGDTLRKDFSAPKRRFAQVHAIKNRYLMLVKNDRPAHLLCDLPWIVLNEIPRLTYMALFAPELLKGIREFFHLLKPMMHKRSLIQARRRVSDSYMRQWFVGGEYHRPT